MPGKLVVASDSWGGAPSFKRGDVVPDDCPYDLDRAKERGFVVSEAEFKKRYPDWPEEGWLANPAPEAQPQPAEPPAPPAASATASPDPGSTGSTGSRRSSSS